jgi:hypothetical protein
MQIGPLIRFRQNKLISTVLISLISVSLSRSHLGLREPDVKVTLAFAVPDQNFGLQFTEDNSEDLLTRLVTAGHAKAKGVKLSIGGWDGCAWVFSLAIFSIEYFDPWTHVRFLSDNFLRL